MRPLAVRRSAPALCVAGAALALATGAFAQGSEPDPGGAYVQVPSGPAAPPRPPSPEPPPEDEDQGIRDGALLMGMLAVRPFVTSIDADGADGDDDPTGVVAGHVGVRAHATGIDDDLIGRFDLEGFLGASTEGLEGEGKAFLSFGLATPIERIHFLFFRFGAGGGLVGNPVVDHQVADLPALEVGYVHVGADGYIELAPRAAMAITAMHAFDTGSHEPDPAPAVGGRLLAGGDGLWGTADYELVTGDHPLHVAFLTACFADKFSLCLDGRLASASLDFAVPVGRERVVALSGGVSFGLGEAEQEY